jgi:phosphatidylglycerol:prolipoprotein diacylglycerol transferase
MVGLGFLFALWYGRREAIRLKLPPEKVADVGFWGMMAGLVGARILFVIVNWEYFSKNPLKIFAIWEGGIVLYGGLITGSLVGVFLVKVWNLPLGKVADIAGPAMMYGLAFGRLGCLAVGDDHGKLVLSALGPKGKELLLKGLLFDPEGRVTQTAREILFQEGLNPPFYSVTFGEDSLVQEDLVGLPLYPTQLIESVGALLIFLFLLVYRKFQRFPGEIFALTLILYPPLRFFNETLRGDLGRGFVLPFLSTSQFISLLIFPAGIYLYVRGYLTWRKSRSQKGKGEGR